MKTTLLLSALSILSLSVVACAGETDATDTDGDVDAAEAELRTAGIKSIEIGRGTGFVPPPPPGSCRASGRYTISLDAKTIKGNGCIENKTITVERKLSDAEVSQVRTAVAGVREVARPQACPTDMPITSLTVKRATNETRYVDARAACGGSSLAAKESTLSKLLDVAEDLAMFGREQSFEGTLKSVGAAIGGETTGSVISTSSGTFELELSRSLAGDFVSGQTARVTGIREDRRGVEIRMRHFIKVSEMLVCPAPGRTVNCMPPTTAKACEPSNRDWISATCKDISFLD